MALTIIDDVERARTDAGPVNRSSDEAELVAGAKAGLSQRIYLGDFSAPARALASSASGKS
jgi:hypothetical protein